MYKLLKDRTLFIATKHKKEDVLAPLFIKELGIDVKVAPIDTDAFGTFSGEISRIKSVVDTLKDKCFKAIETYGADLVLASEGSFGPHPQIGFVPCNEEYLLLMDIKNELEILVKEFSVETNFTSEIVKTQEELINFTDKIHFPSHKIIIRKSLTDFTYLKKGIGAFDDLIFYFNEIKALQGYVYLETDMRAMNNPTRMKVIEKAGKRLIEKLNKFCPKCSTPGFDITEFEVGLPCDWCGNPTQSILYSIATCSKCSFLDKKKFPYGKQVEDPQYCSYCNP